jgi:hypothetical protein
MINETRWCENISWSTRAIGSTLYFASYTHILLICAPKYCCLTSGRVLLCIHLCRCLWLEFVILVIGVGSVGMQEQMLGHPCCLLCESAWVWGFFCSAFFATDPILTQCHWLSQRVVHNCSTPRPSLLLTCTSLLELSDTVLPCASHGIVCCGHVGNKMHTYWGIFRNSSR